MLLLAGKFLKGTNFPEFPGGEGQEGGGQGGLRPGLGPASCQSSAESAAGSSALHPLPRALGPEAQPHTRPLGSTCLGEPTQRGLVWVQHLPHGRLW